MISRALALALGALLLGSIALQSNGLRPLTPDDLLNLERFGKVEVSPDGQTIAYVHQRSLSSTRSLLYPYLFGNNRADVWIAPAAGGTPTNLTNGEASDAGFWSPRWSPDGERLAMLSTKDGNVHLWVWERGSGQMRKLSDRGVDFGMLSPEFIWIDNRRLAAILLPPGEQPLLMSMPGRQATEAWEQVWVRGESSASVLESGIPPNPADRPTRTLMLLDAAGARPPTTVGTSPSILDPRLSPDGRHLAFVTHATMWQPRSGDDPLPDDGAIELFHATVTDLQGRVVTRCVTEPPFATRSTFRWSPDGREFAYIARHYDHREPRVVIRGSLDGRTMRVDLPDVAPVAVEWLGHGDLLVSGEPEVSWPAAEQKRRADWWLVSPGRDAQNLTTSLKAAPGHLFLHGDGRVLTGVAGSDIWQRRLDAETWTKLTIPRGIEVTGVAWPRLGRNIPQNLTRDLTQIVLSARHDRQDAYVRLDLESGEFTPLPGPSSAHATLAAYHPEGDTTVFNADEREGTFLTVARTGRRHTLAAANSFLKTIAEGEAKPIEYRGLDGDALKGWLLLPVDYRTGTRYPLVTWVYAGDMMGEQPPGTASLNSDIWLNRQLFAARGYAVLIPSMPLAPDPKTGGYASDPYFELTKGVLPAVDKAIELGVADPERLALIGHSFGGFSVYGLVTQSNRFKAGIALAGLADLTSMYGSSSGSWRYSTYFHEWLNDPWESERMQRRMGRPPWQDAARYQRNSPISYIDRVETPLLIVHGELDGVAITQAEQVFTALYRQGKRARFVRYWGEGHSLESPANVRDVWTRIYEWLDECLTRPAQPASATQQ